MGATDFSTSGPLSSIDSAFLDWSVGTLELGAESLWLAGNATEEAEAYRRRGAEFVRHGEFPAAVEQLAIAVRLRPDFAPGQHELGFAHLAQQDWMAAIRCFDAALELDSGFSLAWHCRGLARTALGEFAEAVCDFETALRLRPVWSAALQNRGVALTMLGEFDRAIADFDAALALKSENALAWHNRGFHHGTRTATDADSSSRSPGGMPFRTLRFRGGHRRLHPTDRVTSAIRIRVPFSSAGLRRARGSNSSIGGYRPRDESYPARRGDVIRNRCSFPRSEAVRI